MKPGKHAAFSFSLFFIFWYFSKSFYASLFCLLSGIFLDADHALEYLINHGAKEFSLKKCYEACEQTNLGRGPYRFRKVHLIFHSAEIFIILWFACWFIKDLYLFAFTLGYSLHLFLDLFGNKERLRFYFLIWRAINKFDADKVCYVEDNK